MIPNMSELHISLIGFKYDIQSSVNLSLLFDTFTVVDKIKYLQFENKRKTADGIVECKIKSIYNQMTIGYNITPTRIVLARVFNNGKITLINCRDDNEPIEIVKYIISQLDKSGNISFNFTNVPELRENVVGYDYLKSVRNDVLKNHQLLSELASYYNDAHMIELLLTLRTMRRAHKLVRLALEDMKIVRLYTVFRALRKYYALIACDNGYSIEQVIMTHKHLIFITHDMYVLDTVTLHMPITITKHQHIYNQDLIKINMINGSSNVNFCVDLQKFFEVLRVNDVPCAYEPDELSGIKLYGTYEDKQSTIIIQNEGNVCVKGCQSMEQINAMIEFVKTLTHKYYTEIVHEKIIRDNVYPDCIYKDNYVYLKKAHVKVFVDNQHILRELAIY